MSYPRLLQSRLEETLDDTPVVLIHGQRQCGNYPDRGGLRKLQAMAGSSWKMGVVLFDGDIPLSFGVGLLAMPISGLWNKGLKS